MTRLPKQPEEPLELFRNSLIQTKAIIEHRRKYMEAHPEIEEENTRRFYERLMSDPFGKDAKMLRDGANITGTGKWMFRNPVE